MAHAISPSRVESDTHRGRSKRRDWIEIAIAYGLILSVVWTPRPWQRFLWIAAAASIVLITIISFDGWKAMGFRASNLVRSLWIVGAAMMVAVTAMLIAAESHTLLLPGGPVALIETYFAYAIWACAQQFLLQSFFLLRFLRVIPNATVAALTASVLFSTAHLPNPVLVPITCVWGFVACLLFLRYRNIYPLMIAHAILGIAVAMTIPGPADHNMRVGYGYLIYNPHSHLHRRHRLSQP